MSKHQANIRKTEVKWRSVGMKKLDWGLTKRFFSITKRNNIKSAKAHPCHTESIQLNCLRREREIYKEIIKAYH